MKSYFTFFYCALLLLPCTLQSSEKFDLYRFLKTDDLESKARLITDENAKKPHMLFVQYSNTTGRYESKLIPMPTRPILTDGPSYVIHGYFDSQGQYVRIVSKTPVLLTPYCIKGNVHLITIEK